jgi:hypothetical protein
VIGDDDLGFRLPPTERYVCLQMKRLRTFSNSPRILHEATIVTQMNIVCYAAMLEFERDEKRRLVLKRMLAETGRNLVLVTDSKKQDSAKHRDEDRSTHSERKLTSVADQRDAFCPDDAALGLQPVTAQFRQYGLGWHDHNNEH